MEQDEMKQIAIAAVVLALAFTIMFQNGIFGLFSASPDTLLRLFILSMITVSFSFILHELGHRQVARRFGAHAEFKKWNFGLGLALLFSFFGFVFAAPGAVVIHQRADLWGRVKQITRKKMGIIALTGPAINIVLALAFLVVHFFVPSIITSYGFLINAWLALFNLLPIPPLDGFKVLSWDRRIWIASIAIAGIMVFVV